MTTTPTNTAATPAPETLANLRYIAKILTDYADTHEGQICTCDPYQGDGHDPFCLLGFNPTTIAIIAIDELRRLIVDPVTIVSGA